MAIPIRVEKRGQGTMARFKWVALILIGSLLMTSTRVPASAQGKIKLVATFSILGDMVAQVGEDSVDLRVLVPAGSDPHTFEPAPADSVALSEARLIFALGLGFEPWLADMAGASGASAKMVTVVEGIDLLPVGEHPHEGETHEGETPEAEEHDEFDPHVWHNIQNAMIMVGHIRDALITADPDHAARYEANAQKYLKTLQVLDAEVVEILNTIPENQRVLFTNHDVFQYLGARYGLRVQGVLGVTTEAADPSAAELGDTIEAIRASGVPAIFVEAQLNPQIIELIAREAGVEIAPDLYTDSLSDPDGDASNYVAMMRYNATTIAEALSQ